MSYPVITSISTNVSGNYIDFIVDIDVSDATEPTTIGVQYYVSGSGAYNYASYSHYTNDGNDYSYYFYADGVDTGYWYTAYAYLEADGGVVESLTHEFYVPPIYPEIQDVRTDVTGNVVTFEVDIYIPDGAKQQDVFVEYWITGTATKYNATYIRTSGSLGYYTFYFEAVNLEFDTDYSYRACLSDPGTTNVNVYYDGSFYIEPIATILSFTSTVYQNTVSFEVVVKYNEAINPSYYEPRVLLDLSTSEYYNYIATLEQTTNVSNVYNYILGFAGLIYGETFKCEAQVIEKSTLVIVDSQIGDIFTTPEDTSKIINVKFKPKTNKATAEVETTLNYLNNAYKIKIIYDRKEITEESKFVETEMHTTLENNNELFKLIITRLKEKTKYNCIVELYNMSVTMIEGGQLIDKMEGLEFKTLDGFKLWMYLWYKI